MDLPRGGEVLDGDAERFVDGDVLTRDASGDRAQKDLADLTEQVRVADGPLRPGQQEIARFLLARLAAIGEEPRALDRLRIELAMAGEAGAHGIHVGARG